MKLKNWHKFLENLAASYLSSRPMVDSTGTVITPYVTTSSSSAYFGRCMYVLNTKYNFGRVQERTELIYTNDGGTFHSSSIPIGFVFGHESSDISDDDYTISSCKEDALLDKTVNVYTEFSDDFIHATVTAYNTSDSDIVINTIGMYCYAFTDIVTTTPSEDYTEETSLVRSVLLTKDRFTDITIKPNDTVIFTIKVD